MHKCYRAKGSSSWPAAWERAVHVQLHWRLRIPNIEEAALCAKPFAGIITQLPLLLKRAHF